MNRTTLRADHRALNAMDQIQVMKTRLFLSFTAPVIKVDPENLVSLFTDPKFALVLSEKMVSLKWTSSRARQTFDKLTTLENHFLKMLELERG
jgi:hypothetical protein